MPAVLIPDVAFSLRLLMRERVLAWISRDTGLCDFLLPDSVAASWSPEKKHEWMNAIIDNFLHTSSAAVGGKEARRRALSRELAGNLRRGCVRIRNRSVTHYNIAKMGIMLEGLWDIVSVGLDDTTWARCSLLFDTGLIALRVSYLWVYLKDQAPDTELPIDVRKELFQTLVKSFFTSRAPTDNKQDKHSTNFKDLLEVWRRELQNYLEGDDFEKKLARLEQTQSLDETVTCVESFLNALDVDKSWMLDMQHLEVELQNGNLLRKGVAQITVLDKGKRTKGSSDMGNGRYMMGKPASGGQSSTARQGAYEQGGNESESSFEPAVTDSDFNPESTGEEGWPRRSIEPEVTEDEVEPKQKVERNVNVRRSPRGTPTSAGRPQPSGSEPKSILGTRKRRNFHNSNDEPPRARRRAQAAEVVSKALRGSSLRKLRRLADSPKADEDSVKTPPTGKARRSLRLSSGGGSTEKGTKRTKTATESGGQNADAEATANVHDGGGDGGGSAAGRATRGSATRRSTPLSRDTRRRLLSAALMGNDAEPSANDAPGNRRRSLRSSRQNA